MKIEGLEDIEDIENDKELKELSLYQKIIVQNSPKNKPKREVLQESKLSTMPDVLNKMVNQIKPTYERRQIQAIVDELRKHQSLTTLLHGVKPEQLQNEEIVLLLIWTSPLVTSTSNNDEYSIYARGILNVDILQAQGLLRNCQTNENHLINIVESYFNLMRQMPEHQFLQALRNAVYQMDKAYELQSTLKTLGENWFNLKEQIKSLKLSSAPAIENPKLAKALPYKASVKPLKDQQEVDILIKLIPFFEIPMCKSSKVVPEATKLRKLLNIAKSEAEMLLRKKKLYTILDAIKVNFEKLLFPENLPEVEADYIDCFFQSKQRAKLFVSTLARIVWEYNYVNKMFIEHYRKLSNLSNKEAYQCIPQNRDLLVFGGHYPLSSGQIQAMINIVEQFPAIKSLSLNFTRIKNQGVQILSKTLNSKKWKSIRLNDEGLYSLDLTNNFIDQDGMQALLDLFFDKFDMKTAALNNAPLPTSIRILNLDFNFLGQGGMDVLATILSSSRQLKVLSLNRTRIIGHDLKKFCQSIAINPYLKVLSLGQNKLGDVGLQHLSNALKVNIGINILDLFDVEFGDDGALSLAEALLLNKTIFNLRMSNTKVRGTGAGPLINAVIGNTFLKIFRWINLLPLPAMEDLEPKDITRVFHIESRNNPLSRTEYLNPKIGDIALELIQDIHKCSYFTTQKEEKYNQELVAILQSYSDYLIENWLHFEKGTYNSLTERPILNYKQLLSEDIIRDNLPEISLEEKVLMNMDTMEIPKEKAGQMLLNGAPQGQEFKMLEAEKKKTEKRVMGAGSQSPTRKGGKSEIAKSAQQAQAQRAQLDSIPSFSMSDFSSTSPFSRNVAKELMIILLQFGLDLNYLNKQGYTPLQLAIKNKLRSLQNFLLSGYNKEIDVNMRSEAMGKKMSTAIHFAVELNDYDALKLLLDYPGDPKREVGLKDAQGKNPFDLAVDLDFKGIQELLQRHGGHSSSLAMQQQFQMLQIMKPINTKKNESEQITIFNTIIANSMDRFQKLLLQGEDINQRDATNQTPLHYAVQHGREAMLMMLLKQGAYQDSKDNNGMTPLHLAAMKKETQTQQTNLKIIERLVTLGANIDSQMKDGSTPIHLACQVNSFANVKTLCQLGAQIGIFNYAKQTPEQLTTSQEIVQLLASVRAERRKLNGGGDEFITDIA